MGRDDNIVIIRPCSRTFQSTRPRGARRCFYSQSTQFVWFQSTRPRGARQPKIRQRSFGLVVSIHAPAWGATLETRTRKKEKGVSIHAPAWGATARAFLSNHFCICFNPRARVGRDAEIDNKNADTSMFQSTRPRGARLCVCSMNCRVGMFQSTRPRGARLEIDPEVLRAKSVSIHAPAWGATINRPHHRLDTHKVSIHAPAWGATDLFLFRTHKPPCFNPRARVGRDFERGEIFCRRTQVSIHAPAWGATSRGSQTKDVSLCFNPRARVGRDQNNIEWKRTDDKFQSTRPRGARPFNRAQNES